jgi:uncharacterized membrane protein YjdF
MIFSDWIAERLEETGLSMIDKYSWLHFVSGMVMTISVILIATVYYKSKNINLKSKESYIYVLSLFMTLIIGISFEIFENSYIGVNSSIKFMNRPDSGLNMMFDIILNILGCITILILYKLIISKRLSNQNYSNVKVIQ